MTLVESLSPRCGQQDHHFIVPRHTIQNFNKYRAIILFGFYSIIDSVYQHRADKSLSSFPLGPHKEKLKNGCLRNVAYHRLPIQYMKVVDVPNEEAD